MKYLIAILVLGVFIALAAGDSNDSFTIPFFNENLTISLKGDLNKAINQAKPWMNPIITREELGAIEWAKQNTEMRTVFMSDIFGGEVLMANLREGVEGGDWAIVPNVVERMSDTQNNFYQASDSRKAWETAKKYEAEFVWAPNRQVFAGFGWTNVPEFLNDTQYFEKVFDNGARIYKVK